MGARTASSPSSLEMSTPEHFINLAQSLTMTDATQAEQFAGGTVSMLVQKLDLLLMEQVRLTARVATVSASANTPKVCLKHKTGAFSTTVGDYTSIGTSVVEGSIFTGQTFLDTGWVNLAQSAKATDVFIALTSVGGDGVADPVLTNIMVAFR